MLIQPYKDAMAREWDLFVLCSSAGTLLHTRRFLSYHGNRFRDCSVVTLDSDNQIIAVFPAALSSTNKNIVVSHPGVTYGGLLCSNKCRGDKVIQILRAVCLYYKQKGLLALQYKAVPWIYHTTHVQDDLYALFRLNAVRYRCDLSATIDLCHRGKIRSRRKRGYKKAVKLGVRIVAGLKYAPDIWDVLTRNLKDKYGVKPVHSIEEILLLHERFPDHIQFVAALCGDKVEAGVVLFYTATVSHSQYITSSPVGNEVHALDMVFEYCIKECFKQGKRYFDFGTSNEDDGRLLNQGIYGFKSEFGAGGVVHEFYEVALENVNDD